MGAARGRMWIGPCIVLALLAASTAAQERPDFSGEWVLVTTTNSALGSAPELTVRQSFHRTSVFGVPMDVPFVTLTLERHFPTGSRSETYNVGAIGGTVAGEVVGQRRDTLRPETRFSSKWDGDRLVITTASYRGSPREFEPDIEHEEAWWLDSQDRLVVRVAERLSGGESKSATVTYRRR
jgi:hypothetical protein